MENVRYHGASCGAIIRIRAGKVYRKMDNRLNLKRSPSSIKWGNLPDPTHCTVSGCNKKAIYKFYSHGFCSEHKQNGVLISSKANSKRLNAHCARGNEVIAKAEKYFDSRWGKSMNTKHG